ncbi:MAG: hypothetical protein QNJ32_02310 [Xenococcaceae cyanobacterium MO_167.B27]|nr:hypothetical protein [Xenococcaceae cyanobacterium MO_167.B27]
MIAYQPDATQICAEQLTEGEIIRHFTGDTWKVISEPEYTCSGISFEVLCLNVATLPNTQTVVFAPEWRFELLHYHCALEA